MFWPEKYHSMGKEVHSINVQSTRHKLPVSFPLVQRYIMITAGAQTVKVQIRTRYCILYFYGEKFTLKNCNSRYFFPTKIFLYTVISILRWQLGDFDNKEGPGVWPKLAHMNSGPPLLSWVFSTPTKKSTDKANKLWRLVWNNMKWSLQLPHMVRSAGITGYHLAVTQDKKNETKSHSITAQECYTAH